MEARGNKCPSGRIKNEMTRCLWQKPWKQWHLRFRGRGTKVVKPKEDDRGKE
jgi:hypothetical protein